MPLAKRKSITDQYGVDNWHFSENHFLTQIIRIILNVDFRFCAFFARFRIYLPGLSLLAVCKKGEEPGD